MKKILSVLLVAASLSVNAQVTTNTGAQSSGGGGSLPISKVYVKQFNINNENLGQYLFADTLFHQIMVDSATGLANVDVILNGEHLYQNSTPTKFTYTGPSILLYRVLQDQDFLIIKFYYTPNNNQTPPVFLIYPTISTPAVDGQPVTCDPGTFGGTEPVTVVYSWRVDGVEVGTNSNTYTPTIDDVGKFIACMVYLENGYGEVSQDTNWDLLDHTVQP